MSSNDLCTFRALFGARTSGPGALDTFVEVIKTNCRLGQERGWLRQQCPSNAELAFVYLRAVLASRLMEDEDLEDALKVAWGYDDLPFRPQDVFFSTLELPPPKDALEDMERDPIAYIQKILADTRTESGWLRKELFPNAEKKSMQESEKRMIRLQACLLVGLGTAPTLLQNQWGLTKFMFHLILVDVMGMFCKPIVVPTLESAAFTPPAISKRRRPNTPIGYMTRLFVQGDPKTVTTPKDLKTTGDAPELETDPSGQSLTPSPADHEAARYIIEDPEPLYASMDSAGGKTPQSMLRKTVASVLTPFRKIKDNTKTGRESSIDSLQISAMDISRLNEMATPMSTECADDGVSIEVAYDDGGDVVPPVSRTRVLRIDLDKLITSSSADDIEVVKQRDGILLQLKDLQRSVRKKDKGCHRLEFQIGSQTVTFCQVIKSSTHRNFEHNAESHGWLDSILKASVSNGNADDGAKYLLSFLGERYPEALAVAAENIGFMRVVGPEE